jgi:23S rRNA (pseudouridine1915-N3)-methyltransferase
MKLRLVTVGRPAPGYARQGWELWTGRLKPYHSLEISYVENRHAQDSERILQRAGEAYTVALAVEGQQMNSEGLATFLGERAMSGQTLCCIIGGAEGLPPAVTEHADRLWSLSELTFPHDLAMVLTAEALYRASTINAGHPYHK